MIPYMIFRQKTSTSIYEKHNADEKQTNFTCSYKSISKQFFKNIVETKNSSQKEVMPYIKFRKITSCSICDEKKPTKRRITIHLVIKEFVKYIFL